MHGMHSKILNVVTMLAKNKIKLTLNKSDMCTYHNSKTYLAINKTITINLKIMASLGLFCKTILRWWNIGNRHP